MSRKERSPEEKALRKSRRLRRLAVCSLLVFFAGGLLMVDLAYSRMTEEEGKIVGAFSQSLDKLSDSAADVAETVSVMARIIREEQ
ncbi:MAG: hypothetical protein Q4C22_05940 [Bacillota bacterium]|nr:hypothetical protein [Bacillota bacterium]